MFWTPEVKENINNITISTSSGQSFNFRHLEGLEVNFTKIWVEGALVYVLMQLTYIFVKR